MNATRTIQNSYVVPLHPAQSNTLSSYYYFYLRACFLCYVRCLPLLFHSFSLPMRRYIFDLFDQVTPSSDWEPFVG